jgi:hypothetical protein
MGSASFVILQHLSRPPYYSPALQAVAVVALVGAKGSETAYIYFSKTQEPAWRNLRPTL